MFSLGGGGRANNATQGGRIDGGETGTTTAQRRPSFDSDWDNASVQFRDDPSAPNVSARFGEQIRGDSEANDNAFDLNRGGRGRQPNDPTPRGGILSSAPPREITQQWLTADEEDENLKGTTYSGMAAAIQKGGLGSQANIIQDLFWQRSVGGDTAKIVQWKEVMGNLQGFKAYLFVK